MDEGTLERVVVDFWEGNYDVLVCTTIIESGIDMPTVNTLVVERADLLGLGQLHQLRGRVGRAGQRAYAYLFYPQDRQLSEEAYERLKTIGEATELGSGFRIAMRDLEIRGAATCWAPGSPATWRRWATTCTARWSTRPSPSSTRETTEEPDEIVLELPMPAHLPPDYVERDDLRLDAYRRLAAVRTPRRRRRHRGRMGRPVRPGAATGRGVAGGGARARRMRPHRRARRHRDQEPALSGGGLLATLSPITLPQSRQMRLARLYKGATYRAEQHELRLPVRGGAELAAQLVEALTELVPDPAPDDVVGFCQRRDLASPPCAEPASCR